MEVIKRTQYDCGIASDNKIVNDVDFNLNEEFLKNDSDNGSLITIKQENHYVVESRVVDNFITGETIKENCGKIGKVIGNFFQNSNPVNDGKNVNISSNSRSTCFKQIVESKISLESREIINDILEQIGALSNIEKLLLFLKLPKENGTADPLKQPVNPLGNRLEISQTITWIKAHYEENPNVSIPKQVVYSEYMDHCDVSGVKPLSNADFGKVMKQVFSHVRPRRLGTRGNSRYCYSGMSKKRNLSVPALPEIIPEDTSCICKCEELNHETCQNVVCLWASKQLGHKFLDLFELAKFINENHCFAFKKKKNKVSIAENAFTDQKSEVISKRLINDFKRKDSVLCDSNSKEKNTNRSPEVSKRKRVKTHINKDTLSKCRKITLKQKQNCDVLCKAVTYDQSKTVCDNVNPALELSVDGINPLPGCLDLINPDGSTKQKDSSVSSVSENECAVPQCSDLNVIQNDNVGLSKEISLMDGVWDRKLNNNFNCTNIINGISSGQSSKLPIPRLSKQRSKHERFPANIIILPAVPPNTKLKQYKQIKPRPEKEIKLDGFVENVNVGEKLILADQKDKSLCNEVSVGCLEKDALDDYFDREGNSLEQEEELLKYFQPSGVQSCLNMAEMKLEKSPQVGVLLKENAVIVDNSQTVYPSKKSAPKLLKDNNLTDRNSADATKVKAFSVKNNDTSLLLQKNVHSLKPDLVLSPNLNSQDGINSKRRVSFENLPVDVSLSHRQGFQSFTPISPTDKMKTKISGLNPFALPIDTSSSRIKTNSNTQNTNLSPLSNDAASTRFFKSTSSVQPSTVNSPSHTNRRKYFPNPIKFPDRDHRFSSFEDSKKPPAEKLNSSVQTCEINKTLFLPPCSPLTHSGPATFNNYGREVGLHSLNVSEKIPNKTGAYPAIQATSLLEAILLSGKSSPQNNIEFVNVDDTDHSPKSSCNSSRVHSTDPLSVEVSQFFPEENTQLLSLEFQPTFRSQSVPMVSSNALISPLSVTQPAPSYFDSRFGSSVPPTPVPSEFVDFGGGLDFNTESSSSNFLLAPPDKDQHNDSGSDLNEQNSAQNNILLETEITTNLKRIFELMEDDCKTIMNSSGSKALQQISRSHPNTPVPAFTTSSANCNKNDPIVSGFLPNMTCSESSHQLSRSYPSTPVIPATVTGLTDAISDLLSSSNQHPEQSDVCDSETGRNINSLIDHTNLLTEEDDLTLHSLSADLPECEDTFNDLEKEVNNSMGDNDLAL